MRAGFVVVRDVVGGLSSTELRSRAVCSPPAVAFVLCCNHCAAMYSCAIHCHHRLYDGYWRKAAAQFAAPPFWQAGVVPAVLLVLHMLTMHSCGPGTVVANVVCEHFRQRGIDLGMRPQLYSALLSVMIELSEFVAVYVSTAAVH